MHMTECWRQCWAGTVESETILESNNDECTSTLQHIKILWQSLVGDVVDSVDGIVGGEGGEVKLIPLPHLSLTKSNP